ERFPGLRRPQEFLELDDRGASRHAGRERAPQDVLGSAYGLVEAGWRIHRGAPGQSEHNAVLAAPVPLGIAGAWLFLPDCCDSALVSRCAERVWHERRLVNALQLQRAQTLRLESRAGGDGRSFLRASGRRPRRSTPVGASTPAGRRTREATTQR